MKNTVNAEKLRSWKIYVLFLFIGIVSPPVSMLILPNFLRLDGAVQFYAALAFGLILMTLAFYFLTKSLNVVLKAVGLYVALFLLLFLGFSRVIFLDSLLTFIILPFFMVLLILLIVLSKFRKS
ncbi:hypothetical protein DRP07_04845, partial [Archaeoglobales archaeon]